MTNVEKKLERMADVARAATPGPWRSTWPDPTPMSALGPGDLQTIVESTNDGVQGEMDRQVVGMIAFQDIVVACREPDAEHIATFSPDVAAALVEVARAAWKQDDCPFCRLPKGIHQTGWCPLGKLEKILCRLGDEAKP